MHFRRLGRTGLQVSVLSLGASPLGGAFRPVDESEGIRTVHAALDLGINFIDTSPHYGDTRSEAVLGRALKGVRRDRFILGTKVGQYRPGEFDFSGARVRRSVDESCSRLGLDHLDIVQCHDIEFADLNQVVNETLPALVQLRQAGRIGHIGITGLPLKIFPAVIDRAGPEVVELLLSFCHYELNDRTLESLLPYCRERDIGVINAAPTGMGLLTDRGPPDWHPAPPAIRAAGRKAAEFCRARGEDIVKLAVQFSVSHPGIATTVIGTANPDNLRRNVGYAEAPVDFALMAEVLALLRPVQNHNFTRGRPENHDPILS
ncbi:MAG TPA: aldo/keto reductase [Opitutaceae bacterium]|nr:aldo/keto reductase [Opitutaceae bacterium]